MTMPELWLFLALGGLTPSLAWCLASLRNFGLIPCLCGESALARGDFTLMKIRYGVQADIDHGGRSGAYKGIVFGILTEWRGRLIFREMRQNPNQSRQLNGLKGDRFITPSIVEYRQTLEDIIELGCEQITNFQVSPAMGQGRCYHQTWVQRTDGRLSIMKREQVYQSDNVETGITQTLVKVHLSGKSTRASHMTLVANSAKWAIKNSMTSSSLWRIQRHSW